MNLALIEVYEEKRKSHFRWGLPPAGRSLDEIIIGDINKRDENREKYISQKFGEHLEKVFAQS